MPRPILVSKENTLKSVIPAKPSLREAQSWNLARDLWRSDATVRIVRALEDCAGRAGEPSRGAYLSFPSPKSLFAICGEGQGGGGSAGRCGSI